MYLATLRARWWSCSSLSHLVCHTAHTAKRVRDGRLFIFSVLSTCGGTGSVSCEMPETMWLVYLISPRYGPSRHHELEKLEASFPGTLVDWKTLYSAPLTTWSAEALSSKCIGE